MSGQAIRKSGDVLAAIVEVQNDGYSAFIDTEEHAITSTGETLFELRENIQEALDLFLETANEFHIDTSHFKGKKVELRLDVKQLFDLFESINIAGFARYTGLNRSLLNQYAKGLKTPSEKQSLRILKGIHRLGKELASISAI